MKFSSKLFSQTFIPCLFLLAGGCTKTESGLTGVGLGSAVGAGIGYAIDGGAGGALAGAALGGIAGGAVGVATNNEDEEPRTSKQRRTVEEVPSSYRSEDELERARTEVKRKRLERTEASGTGNTGNRKRKETLTVGEKTPGVGRSQTG